MCVVYTVLRMYLDFYKLNYFKIRSGNLKQYRKPYIISWINTTLKQIDDKWCTKVKGAFIESAVK